MKAALYLRIGAGQQAECHSPAENQRTQLMALAEELGMVVQKVYEDIGFSGVSLDRPALQALLKDVKDGQMDSVLVFNPSRFSRDSFQTAKLVKQLQESGVQVRTPTGGVDGYPYESDLSQQIVEQYQRQRKEQKKQAEGVHSAAKSV